MVETANNVANNGTNFQIWIMFFVQVGMFILAIAAIYYHRKQIKADHDWNRRHAAAVELLKIKNYIKEKIGIVDNKFIVMNRKENNPIKVEDIHKEICEMNENGDFKQDNENDRRKLREDQEAKDLYRAIRDILNLYEHIAMCVNQEVFDKKIVKELEMGNIIKFYSIFYLYIEHVNEMYPKRKGNIWINLKKLAIEFSKERNPEDSIEKRDKTG